MALTVAKLIITQLFACFESHPLFNKLNSLSSLVLVCEKNGRPRTFLLIKEQGCHLFVFKDSRENITHVQGTT